MKIHRSIGLSVMLALVCFYLAQLARAAALPNAWQIADSSATSLLNYNHLLSSDLHAAATNSGFRFSVESRYGRDYAGPKSIVMLYGMGDYRYQVWWYLDNNNDLIAELQDGVTYRLTTNGTGSRIYHMHEIIYDANSRGASYVVDGQVMTNNWKPVAINSPAGDVYWGAGSTAGQGSMNFHRVAFQITNTIVALYDAGFGAIGGGSHPTNQGWMQQPAAPVAPPFGVFVSADSVPLPTAPDATTSVASEVFPQKARISGAVNTGGLSTTAWLEWGKTSAYGNTTPTRQWLSGAADTVLLENLTDLAGGLGYHYRCAASNVLGVAYGEDAQFTTPLNVEVTTLTDNGSGSLREAIANSLAGDTITFATNGIIQLTSGQLDISEDIAIVGPGPTNLSVYGNERQRVFRILSSATVTMSGLSVAGGHAPNGTTGAPGTSGFDGGGVHNAGDLTLSNCVVAYNTAGNGGSGRTGFNPDFEPGGDAGPGGDGGGIYNSGNLTLVSCSVHDNRCGVGGEGGTAYEGVIGHREGFPGGDGGRGGSGGAIYSAGGTITVIASCLYDNLAAQGGKGGWGGFGDNQLPFASDGGPGGNGGAGGSGGGLYIEKGGLDFVNSTLSGNYLDYQLNYGAGGSGSYGGNNGPYGKTGAFGEGGGVYIASGVTASFNHATIIDNRTSFDEVIASGIRNRGILSLTNSIVVRNTIKEIDGSFNSVNVLLSGDPQLAPLGNYGGLTETMPPMHGSPAIDTGFDIVLDSLSVDQRGYPRRSGAHVDLGAAEARSAFTTVRPELTIKVLNSYNYSRRLTFPNPDDTDFTVLASTNIALPLIQWTPLGVAVPHQDKQFEFTDFNFNDDERFYYLISP